MKFIKYASTALFGLYIAVCIFAFTLQRSLLFFPPNSYLTPKDVGLEQMQELTFYSGLVETTSWWYPASADGKKTVVFFHGNGSAVYSNYHIFADLIEDGHGVLSVGYPGYPAADMGNKDRRRTQPSQDGMVAIAKLNYETIIGQGVSPDDIVYFGTSLGSGVAAQLSTTYPPALLIMDVPFNSILNMAQDRLPFLPVNLLMRDKFESGKALRTVNVPLIWTHGTLDAVVPLSEGQTLFDGYGGPKTAHIIDGGRHTNLWGLGTREIVLDALAVKP